MADLTDRKAFMKWASKIPVHDLSDGRGLCRVIFAEDFLKALKDLPSAERHGKWLHKNSTFKNHWLCSECGYTWYFDTKEANYCPHCGARMRGE